MLTVAPRMSRTLILNNEALKIAACEYARAWSVTTSDEANRDHGERGKRSDDDAYRHLSGRVT